MIIYENSITGFINDCQGQYRDMLITQIKRNMKTKIGRGVSPAEERSWRTTLIKVGSFLSDLNAKDNQYVLLEFKVPYFQKRIDVILVGKKGDRKTLLIIELKGWSKSYHSQVPKTLEIDTKYRFVPHPSHQALEYKNILIDQCNDITKQFDNIDSIALLPNYELSENDPLYSKQFYSMIKAIKIYTKENINEFKNFIGALFANSISRKYVNFLDKLEYKPSLKFHEHLKNEFKKIKLSTSQELAYNRIVMEMELHLENQTNNKLIIISGLPGTGKTIIAFKILAYIYAKRKTTARLQLPGPEFRESIKSTRKDNDFVNMVGGAYAKGAHAIQIIDEAHKASGQGTSSQFYNTLFKNAKFVIALVDDQQVINKAGFTKGQIKEIAQKNRFDTVEMELEEQFRSGKDALYIDWLKNWIFNDNNYQDKYVNNFYNFEVLDDKTFNLKYRNMYEKNEVRMASFWTQKWNAQFDENGKPKRLIKVGNSRYIWNPNDYWVKSFKQENGNQNIPKEFIKNVVNKNFITDKKGYEYIAYFNTVQGSEFDYIFVHIPKLFYLNEKTKLDVNLMELDFSEMKYQCWMKNLLPNKEKEALNKLYFKNRLLVNLTRGKKGTYIYCEDEKLATWIKNKLIRK